METIVVAILFAYLLVSAIGIFVGLDLRKRPSWLFGAFGFLSGFLIGFLIADVQAGLLGGALFAFIVLYGGAMVRWHRQRFKE